MKIKNVLLLSKQSAYTLYFIDHDMTRGKKNSSVIKESQARFKAAHDEHHATLTQVKTILKEYQINFFAAYRGHRFNYNDFDLVITIGGDGTFLEAARWATNQKMLGVNSAPSHSVGRFCQTTAKNFEKAIQQILTNSADIRLLSRLRVKIGKNNLTVPALNDILLCHHNPAYLCRYSIQLGSQKEEHRGSGVWVATPSGSSGAIHSAGGKKLNEFDQRYQYVARELYAKRKNKYQLTKGVLPAATPIEMTSLMRSGIIYFDGPHYHVPFSFGDSATIDLTAPPLQIFDL